MPAGGAPKAVADLGEDRPARLAPPTEEPGAYRARRGQLPRH
ncbi:hypothetical protein [Streptomyces sparsogenes]